MKKLPVKGKMIGKDADIKPKVKRPKKKVKMIKVGK